MNVFAFDRDHTVDVSPHPERPVVPHRWVTHLACETEHEVWAIGNQDLKAEADIPGIQELVRRLDNEWYEKLGDQADEKWFEEWPTGEQRLRMIEELFPAADEYTVVDDADLSAVEGWSHYYAWDFVEAVLSGSVDVEFPGERNVK